MEDCEFDRMIKAMSGFLPLVRMFTERAEELNTTRLIRPMVKQFVEIQTWLFKIAVKGQHFGLKIPEEFYDGVICADGKLWMTCWKQFWNLRRQSHRN
jgi:hypothetical protein